jgi:hypothetical protein
MSIPEELAYEHQCGGSSRSYCKDPLGRISTRSPQDLLTRTYTRLRKGLGQHVTRISSRSAQKELEKTCSKIFMPGPRSESHKIVIKGPAGKVLTRS